MAAKQNAIPDKTKAPRRKPDATKAKSVKRKVKKAKRTPRTHKPDGMTLEQWQIALRREFAAYQTYKIVNIGTEPFFSEFRVTNPESGGEYRVAIRGQNPGDNFCSCPDFAVNLLGMCKHTEAVLARLHKRRGGAAALRRGFTPPYSEVFLRYGIRRQVVFRPGTACPKACIQTASRYFDENGLLQPENFAHFHKFLAKTGSDAHELRCYEDAIEFVAARRDDQRRRERIDKTFPKSSQSTLFTKLLKLPLYPYQREAALFAAKAGRSLIADDMGLGKTIQAIAATEILARLAGVEKALVICPTSLKHQWRDEIEKFTDRAALVVEGSQTQRAALYATKEEDAFFKIVNYDVIHRDLPAIRAWAPDLIVLDEAQRIKNWKTRAARAVKRMPSQYAIVLTGTPLENRLEELHSIVEFVDRFRLGPAYRFLAKHQHVDDHGRVIGYRNLSSINATLKPILLRRTKTEVLKQLPKRLDKTFFVPMTPEQSNLHEENREIVAKLAAKWRRHRFLSELDQRRLTIALQRMRMACNSTYLLDQKTDFGMKCEDLMALLEEIFEQPETKVVIFSQWRRTHELIERRLQKRRWGLVLFHGGVPSKERKHLVQRFKEDPECRVFLSTDAGGVGLNLQNASVVVNMDQPWNPAVLEQRVGRAHRIGQKRPVRVINFVSQGTIEHGMLKLLAFKRSVFDGALDGASDEVFLGGTRLSKFMESVEQTAEAIPTPMPPGNGETAEAQEIPSNREIAKETAEEERAANATARVGAAPASQQQAWADVAAAGLSLLEKLNQALVPPPSATDKPDAAQPTHDAPGRSEGDPTAQIVDSLIHEDPASGERYLRLPVPAADVLEKAANLLSAFATLGKQKKS